MSEILLNFVNTFPDLLIIPYQAKDFFFMVTVTFLE